MTGLKPRQPFAPPSFMDDPEQEGSYLDPRLAAMADTSGYESNGDGGMGQFVGSPDPSVNGQPLQQPPPPGTSGALPPIDPSRAMAAQRRLAEVQKQAPVMPQPKWWQRVLAGAEGGMAGYANAAGRTRPIDPSAAIQGTLAPGYQRAKAIHDQQVAAAQAEAEAEQKNLGMATGVQQAADTSALHQAQAAEAKQRGESYTATAKAIEAEGKNRYLKVGDGVFDKQVGAWAQPPRDKSKLLPIDPNWAKENAPALLPDADGRYYIPIEWGSQIIKAQAKAENAPPAKVPLSPEQQLAARAVGVDPANYESWSPEQARAVEKEQEKHRQSFHIHVGGPTAASDKRELRDALNDAYVDAGGDWAKVAANAQTGKYGPHSAEIAKAAQAQGKPSTDAAKRGVNAQTAVETAQDSINQIQAFVKQHPELVGNAGRHPINALTRWGETKLGSEPPEIGNVDTTLESLASLQPGQHGFRSATAVENFKKSIGVDPRTGKPDGSRAWLANPQKAIQGLQSIINFNTRLKQNLGPGAVQTGGGAALAPASTVAVRPDVQALLGPTNVKPGIHKLSDGTVWLKNPDGSIVKQ